jgi:hypothetical protein
MIVMYASGEIYKCTKAYINISIQTESAGIEYLQFSKRLNNHLRGGHRRSPIGRMGQEKRYHYYP